MRCTASLALLALASTASAVNATFDCAAREYAYEFAQQLQSWRGAVAMKEVFDGLELASKCNQTFDASLFVSEKHVSHFPVTTELVHYVSVQSGSDDVSTPGRGEISLPFATVHAAVESIRKIRSGKVKKHNPATIVLREGRHRLLKTLKLTPEDSYLTFQNHAGELSELSGSYPLKTSWERQSILSGNAYATYIGDQIQNHLKVLGLRVNTTQRGFKATFPNRNPELSIFPHGWVSTKEKVTWTKPRTPKTKPVFVEVEEPHLEDKTMFSNYVVGVNDTCEIFTPPVSYWCCKSPQGGGAVRFEVPSGITVPDTVGLKKYAGPEKGVFQVWRPGHWASWMFEVDEYDRSTGKFTFGRGGFQGARGSKTGAEWYIEDVFEEMDSAQEYYYNDTTGMLYFVYNASMNTPPPASLQFDAVVLETLVSLEGTMENPVQGVSLQGLRIADAGPTYLTVGHGVPSGGDWALQRAGALFFEGTENCSLRENLVTKLDGNAVMISGYNRGMVIEKNEFSWIGDSAMASWGYSMPLNTKGNMSDSVLAQYKNGIDATDGNQPLGTQVIGNFVHELGHFEKQSSFWFQAITAQSNVTGNIAFNIPRAGINFNDGFGGDSTIAWNLVWNTCRESTDHADVNTWDRQPFLSTILNGTKTLQPQYNYIHHNFIIGNDGAVSAVDNDDGSSWYVIHHNFLVYGGHKTNFGGHNKTSHDNINAMAQVYQNGLCVRDNSMTTPGVTDSYHNNRCIQDTTDKPAYLFYFCDPNDLPKSPGVLEIYNNKIYNPTGVATVLCNTSTITHEEFQKGGFDLGTTVATSPAPEQIIAWAKEILSP